MSRDILLTFDEARAYLKVHATTLYRLAQRGKIPASKVGRAWRFKRRDIDEWLKEQSLYYKNKS